MDILKISLIPVLLFAGIGLKLAWKRGPWRYLENFIVYVTYPILMFTEMVRMNFGAISIAETIAISLLYMCTCFVVSYALSRRMSRVEMGTVVINSTFFNSMFLPFPLIYAFYGDLSLALVFSLPYMIVHNTAGVFLASRWGKREGVRWTIYESVKFPPLIAFAAGLLARPLLGGIASSGEFLLISGFGSLTVYLSLVFAGLMIPLSRDSLTLRRRVPALITFIRFLISPLIAAVLIVVLGISGNMRNTFIIMSIMPTAFTNVIISSRFGLDVSSTAQSVFIPTFVSIGATFALKFFGIV
ncbi:MAG: AEC family transporter [Candidatus Hadarchaeales archaeon]